MSVGARRTWLLAAVVFLAALAGVLIGRGISDQRPEQPSALHEFLHDELDLDAGQLDRIEGLEKQFAIRKRALGGSRDSGLAALRRRFLRDSAPRAMPSLSRGSVPPWPQRSDVMPLCAELRILDHCRMHTHQWRVSSFVDQPLNGRDEGAKLP